MHTFPISPVAPSTSATFPLVDAGDDASPEVDASSETVDALVVTDVRRLCAPLADVVVLAD